MKTFNLSVVSIILIYFFVSFTKQPKVGELLATSLDKNIYKQFDTLRYDSVFLKELADLSKTNENLKSNFRLNNKLPNFVINFFGDKGLDSLLSYLDKSAEHGFNPKVFHNREIKQLIEKLKLSDFSSVDESYPFIARLEILSADAYIRYTNYLKFGLVNPKNIFLRYYIDVKQADSISTFNLLNSVDILDTLRAVQNKSSQYKFLQKHYVQSKNDSIKKILAINMERLRWVLPSAGEKYIQVNIPEFKLVYFNGKDTLTSMKVCVGGRRDIDYEEKLKVYEKTGDLDDKPQNRETPLLFSKIKSLYSNPTWNIPESIAQTEIYTSARRSSSYLRRHNIAVYYKNKLIENPSRIRWYKYDRKKLPFLFVQQSGPENSLGKLKFMFPNKSSVYLHDTNFREAFKLKYRAISHGCVRLEKPLKLAELLIADNVKNDKVRLELGLKPLFLKDSVVKDVSKIKDEKTKLLPLKFYPKEETPLIITYFTAWEQNSKIQYCPDVYGMDEKLWDAMKKFR